MNQPPDFTRIAMLPGVWSAHVFRPDIDLAAIPLEQRGAVAALVREVVELKDINKRLEHL